MDIPRRTSPASTRVEGSFALSSSLSQLGHGGCRFLRREVGIPQRHRDVGVAEQLADRVQVLTGHDELGGEVVARVMEAEALHAGSLHQSAPGRLDRGQPVPIWCREDQLLAVAARRPIGRERHGLHR